MSEDSAALIDQLKPNHMPEPISGWQLAPGWLILSVLIILFIGLLIFYIMRWRKNKYRREALKQYRLILKNTSQPSERLRAINLLLKRVALTAYPRDQVSSLTGEAWLLFLNKTGNTDNFSQKSGRILGHMHYQTNDKLLLSDQRLLYTSVIHWIKHHHV